MKNIQVSDDNLTRQITSFNFQPRGITSLIEITEIILLGVDIHPIKRRKEDSSTLSNLTQNQWIFTAFRPDFIIKICPEKILI